MYFLLSNFLHKSVHNIKTEFQIYSFIVRARNFSVASPTSSATSDSPEEQKDSKQKSLHVAVIGVPNAGKSTFINNLIHHRVCPTSSKVHTTRRSHKAICTVGNRQLVIFDTPGLVTPQEIKKHSLESTFKSSFRNSIQNADAIAVLHDVSNSWTRNELNATVLETLNAYPKLPSVLILNKIDVLKSKRVLLDLVRLLTNETLSLKPRKSRTSAKIEKDASNSDGSTKTGGWSHFSDIFMVSSITGDGLQGVLNYFLSQSKPIPWEYPAEAYTDIPPQELIVDSVRARLLDYLPQEIPYTLKTDLEYYSEENNTIYAAVQITCPNPRIEKLICGEGNGKIKQITERITSDLVETFGKKISLSVSTIAKKSADSRA